MRAVTTASQQPENATRALAIARTHDMGLVRSVLEHPSIWPHIHDDDLNSPAPEDLPGFYWLLVSDGLPGGVFLLHAHNAVCFEIHVCLLPRLWGAQARRAGELCFEWAFTNTPCRKLIANIPEDNLMALRFAQRCGFSHEGVNRDSFLKGGKLLDQCALGLTKADWCEARI